MYWTDEGYLLSKTNFDENSIIIDAFTLKHGKYTGVVYGGSSRKNKRNFQIGNKILFNWKSKNENRTGYFNVELIEPISPMFFDNKKKIFSILSATSLLKILLPERQINENIYNSFEKMINNLRTNSWIQNYILWEFSLIKELGYEITFNESKNFIMVNNKSLKVPKILYANNHEIRNSDVKEGLIFCKLLLIDNFIEPNKLKFPNIRNILEEFYY